MNDRLALQLKKVARVLSILDETHTPVYRIELDASRSAPLIHVGGGPFGWNAVGFGVDDQGAWTDYAAHLRGVELFRRTRARRSLPRIREAVRRLELETRHG